MNVHSDYVSSVDSSNNPGLGPSPVLIICSIDVPSLDPSHGPSNVLISSLGINSPNYNETNNNPSRDPSLHPNDLNVVCNPSRDPSLHPNDLNLVCEISLNELDAYEILTTYPIPTVSALNFNPVDQLINAVNAFSHITPSNNDFNTWF